MAPGDESECGPSDGDFIRFLWMQYFYQFQTKLFLRLPIDRLLVDVFLIRLAARGRTKELYFLLLKQRPKVHHFS